MKTYKEIYFNLPGGKKDYKLIFGQPNSKKELDQMFELRYQVYLKHDYIHKEMFPKKREKDIYDEQGKCTYFIAKLGNGMVVGSLRLIRDYFLPTEKECFKFKEPEEITKIPRNQRVEISRLVARPCKINGDHHLPRHLVLLGLLRVALDFSLENDIKGGYSFIKQSLGKKLRKLGIPFHLIKNYQQIYNKKILWKYFNQKEDPVFPVYFLRDEINDYFEKLFNSRLIFEKIGEEKYKFKKIGDGKILILKIISFLHNKKIL
jgi:N-acyl-L-homoserine lactone synthetase